MIPKALAAALSELNSAQTFLDVCQLPHNYEDAKATGALRDARDERNIATARVVDAFRRHLRTVDSPLDSD